MELMWAGRLVEDFENLQQPRWQRALDTISYRPLENNVGYLRILLSFSQQMITCLAEITATTVDFSGFTIFRF